MQKLSRELLAELGIIPKTDEALVAKLLSLAKESDEVMANLWNQCKDRLVEHITKDMTPVQKATFLQLLSHKGGQA